MSTAQRLLIGFYAVIALAGLVTTWGQNLQLMTPGMGPLDPYTVFAEQVRVNAASRSITVDIGFFLLAASAFMVIEARRLGLRLVWLYIVLGFLVAISFAFPLFMIARELKLARHPDAPAAWRLTASDVIGLAIVAAAIAALTWRILS
jgi:hypothetical protein